MSQILDAELTAGNTSNGNAELDKIQNFQGKYPKQLWYLFFSEMWERFSFYGMRGMLVVFMVSQLGMNEGVANLQYGATQAFVYAFTFIGGLLAVEMRDFLYSIVVSISVLFWADTSVYLSDNPTRGILHSAWLLW